METIEHIKKSAKRVSLFSLLMLPFYLIGIKIGYRKWEPHNKPVSLDVFFSALPRVIVFYLINALCFFIVYAIILILSKGSNDLYICTECENVLKNGKWTRTVENAQSVGLKWNPWRGFMKGTLTKEIDSLMKAKVERCLIYIELP